MNGEKSLIKCRLPVDILALGSFCETRPSFLDQKLLTPIAILDLGQREGEMLLALCGAGEEGW